MLGDNSKKMPSGTAVLDEDVLDAIFAGSGHMTPIVQKTFFIG